MSSLADYYLKIGLVAIVLFLVIAAAVIVCSALGSNGRTPRR